MSNPRQGRVNAEMRSWGDREIARFIFRRDLLIKRGLTERQADAWGDVLALRDQQRDDRRSCLECKHLNGRRCDRGDAVVIGLLQRCPQFTFQKP